MQAKVPQKRNKSTLQTKSNPKRHLTTKSTHKIKSTSTRSSSSFPSTITAPIHTLTFPSVSYSTSLISSPSSPTSQSIDLSQPFDITQTIHHKQHSRSKLTSTRSSTHKSKSKSITTTTKRSVSFLPPSHYKESRFGSGLSKSTLNYLIGDVEPEVFDAVSLIPMIHDKQTVPETTNTQHIDETIVTTTNNNPIDISTISPTTLKGKKVLLRSDIDIVFEQDPTNPKKKTISQSSLQSLTNVLPTIQYLHDAGAQIIISSHAGVPPVHDKVTAEDLAPYSFQPIAQALTQLLSKKITLIEKPFQDNGASFKNAIENVTNGDIILLDNMRLYDDELSGEVEFAQQVLDIIQPELCVYDSFTTSLADDATIQELPILAKNKNIPTVAGLYLTKEIQSTHKFIQESLVGKNIQKTFIFGGQPLSDYAPVLQSTFNTTQNFIFGGETAYAFSHADHVTLAAYDASDEEEGLEHSLTTDMPVAFGDIPVSDIGSAISLLSNASKTNKSIWYPHDWNVKNRTNPRQTFRRSVVNEDLYDDKSLIATDLGVSTRKDFAFAIDNIIADQQNGKDQVIFWSGSMGQLDQDNIYGNGTIIEALDKATNAGVTTVVGGASTIRAIELYTQDSDAKVKNPKFSFVTSSPTTVAAMVAGTSVFNKLEQVEKH